AEADRHSKLGGALYAAGQLPDALRELETAMTSAAAALGDNHPKVARYALLLGNMSSDAGHLDQAVDLSRRAVSIYQTWYGLDDVRVETALHGLGDALEIRGDFQESRAALTRALDIARRVGEDPATIARIEGDPGNTDDDAGDPAAALVHYQSAEEVLKKSGAGPLLIARVEINIAYAEEHRGRRPEALVHAKNALAAFEAGESPDS